MEATFESAAEGLDKTGASVYERELVEKLTQHGKEEGVILERYQRFVQEGPSAAARYLVQLILDDERRHHQLLAELANAVAWGGNADGDVDAMPDLYPKGKAAPSFAEETKELLATERRDREELRRLRRELKPYHGNTMWPLIIDLMLLDTEKHTKILRFISKYAT